MTAAVDAPNSLHVTGPKRALRGEAMVPGDKSISHRTLILGSIADGTSRVRNLLAANDCIATMEVMRSLGVEIEQKDGEVLVHGKGLHSLREPARPLECGGSGTTMRLVAGLLSGQPFYSVLAGNSQLSRRPMDRVATPLRLMGATILGREGGRLAPLSIMGGDLKGIAYSTPVASAQVKSAILLAGLFADGATWVEEPFPSRDHTERMLRAMDAPIEVSQAGAGVSRADSLSPLDLSVPGDMSSAAFLLVAGCIVPGSHIVLPGVGVNMGRTGIVEVLRRMGAQIGYRNEREECGEPVADIEVAHSELRGTTVEAAQVPAMIDELLALAVAATQAEGVTEVRGAGELRVKETDRIATTVGELSRMGARIEALPDGFRVEGPCQLRGTMVDSHGDHRLAMALAVAGLVAEGETVVEDAACTQDSFPGFEEVLRAVTGGGRLQ